MEAKPLTENTFYHTKSTTYQFLFTATYEYSNLVILQDIHNRSRMALELGNFIELIELGVYRLENNVR